MGNPLVSIVISSYNYEKYLENAILSALDQSYQHVEVVVVDDGSTDRSRAIITEFGARIRPVFQENQGITGACNAGFVASRGTIVVFLDADDALCPAAIEEVVSAWTPGAIKVQFCLQIIDRDGKSSGAVLPAFPEKYSPNDLMKEFLLTGNYRWPTTSGNAYARSFLEQVMPLPVDRFPFAPDGAINTIAPLFGEIVSVNKVLGFYRIHGANHWALLHIVPAKFGAYVDQKQKEISFLQQHAQRRGITFANKQLLDGSIVHLEYRLAALKLKQPYLLAREDRPFFLCWRAIPRLVRLECSLARRLSLLAWFVALTLATGRLAKFLIELRFVSTSRPPMINMWLERLHVLQPRRRVERS
jgi:glycosyltransferase involved in cell wall biosynthesis